MSIGIKEVQSFWDSRPCNIKHSPLPVGSIEYFNEVEIRKYFVEPHIPGFADFPQWKNKKVFEVGCGIGTDAVNFARNGADYTGIDLSHESVKITQDRLNTFGLPGKVFQANAEEISNSFQGTKFDLIYSFGVLHHTPDMDSALTSLRSLMNNQSVLKVMLYAKNSWKSAMIDAGLDQPEAQYGCPIANTFTREEVRFIFARAGLKVDSIGQEHIFPYKIDEYKNYKYELQPWFKAMPKEVFSALEKSLGWHLLISASIANQNS